MFFSLWGFKKVPHEDTCVWVLQISVYNYTLGNYDCFTETGFICEIELPVRFGTSNNGASENAIN